jgi:hypothetical protein
MRNAAMYVGAPACAGTGCRCASHQAVVTKQLSHFGGVPTTQHPQNRHPFFVIAPGTAQSESVFRSCKTVGHDCLTGNTVHPDHFPVEVSGAKGCVVDVPVVAGAVTQVSGVVT